MERKPRWRLLYAIFPLSVALLWLDGRLTLLPQEHQLFEMGIVLLSFGWMALWVRAHTAAPADESAAPIMYFVLPDAKCGQASDLSAGVPDWQPISHAGIDERAQVELKGKYN